MKLKTILLTPSFIILYLFAQAQVTGKVYYKEGQKSVPLIGANVYWQGTQEGTATDNNGSFSTEKPASTNVLLISFVGYGTDTIVVNENNRYLEIILTKTVLLDEVTIGERNSSSTYARLDPIGTQQLTGEELKKAACCNLGESFETNASVDANYNDASTGAKQIKLLGLSGKYVQMLTENIPNFYGLATSYGMEYIPGSWMNSIAISKGTASVSYGYEAITGQINTWYKEPDKKADYFYLNLLGNTAGKTEINMDGSFNISKKVSSMILIHGGYDFFQVDHNNDGFMDMPSVKKYILFNRYNIHWSDDFETKIGVKYLFDDRTGGQLPDMVNPYQILIRTNRLEAFLKSGYFFANKSAGSVAFISGYSYHNQNGVYGNKLYNAFQNSIYTNVIYSTELGSSEIHSFQSGASYKYDAFNENLNDSVSLRQELVPGVFAEYTLKPSAAFTGVLGMRVDYHNLHGFFYTPRMHIRYKVTGTTTLRATAGSGTRTANALAENSYLLASSRRIVFSEELKPEKAWNIGGSVIQEFPIGNRTLTLIADFYRTWFINQVVIDMDTDVHEVNFGNLKGNSYSNVGQIEVQYPFIKGMDFTAAFRYNDVKQTIGDILMKVPFTSRYKGLLSLSYKTPLKKWQFDITSQFNGGGRIPSTAQNPVYYQRADHFDPYTILNAQITKYFKVWEIYAGVENLTNFVQHDPIIASENPWGESFDGAMIWGPVHGRKFYIGIRYAIERDITKPN